MSAYSILLRVLLVVALILNGSSYALASAHTQVDMHMQQLEHAALAGIVSNSSFSTAMAVAPPCPEHELGLGSMSADSPASVTATGASAVEPGYAPPDCCKSGSCNCACVHQSQAAEPAVAFQVAVVEEVGNVRPMKSGHESPAVPHLIRPPIV